MQSGWSAGLRGTRRRKEAGLKGLEFRRRTPRRRLPNAARRDRQTGGGPAARAGATEHAPRGAPLDGGKGGTPPGNKDEASEGGGAKGPCAPPPHASPPPAQRRAAGSSDRLRPRAGAGLGGCTVGKALRGPFGGRCIASGLRNHWGLL